MQKSFEQSLRDLQNFISTMSQEVEDAVEDATDALKNSDVDLVKEVIRREELVDTLHDESEVLISTILARQQPVAGDLRVIISSMKISSDLERIADHALNIAESAETLSSIPHVPEKDNLVYMSQLVREMLAAATDCYAERNSMVARGVINADDEVDEYNRIITQNLITDMTKQKVDIKIGMEIIRVCKNLERIADLATNIAEDVMYINDGRFARHDHAR
jgi:phosphate transport system protein